MAPINFRCYGHFSKSAKLQLPAMVINRANVYIHNHVIINAGLKIINQEGKVHFGNYSLISYNLTIVTGNHHPIVGIPMSVVGQTHAQDKETDIFIGEDAWIGANVTLLSGAKIGRGAIVGANTLVNSEIPPYSIVVGTPGKIISWRFNKDQIMEHERQLYAAEDRLSEAEIENLFHER